MPSTSFYSMTEDEYSELARAIIEKLNLTSVDQITRLKGSTFASSIRNLNITMDSVFSQDGTLYFNADIPDYACYNNKNVRKVVIGENVTYIGRSAFYGCTNLQEIEFNAIDCTVYNNSNSNTASDAIFGDSCPITSVIIGNSVESIPNCLFNVPGSTYRNTSINGITIPSSCTSIGNYTFRNWKGLKSITLHNDITNIGVNAFQNCSGLQSIVIPTGVTQLNNNVFDGCSNLETVTLHDGITTIGGQVFRSTAIKTFETPESLTSFGTYVFDGSLLEELYLTAPNLVANTGQFWLSAMHKLKKLVVGASIASFPNYCFYNTDHLEEVVLLKADGIVTASGSSTFQNSNMGSPGVSIYVPESLIETYKTTNYWASGTIPDNFVSYETTMTIDGVSYNCNYGDSWAVFIESVDNVDSFVISGNNVLNAAKTKYVSINSKAVTPNDLILGLDYSLDNI